MIGELPSDAEEIKSTLLSEDSEHVSDLLRAADEDVLSPDTPESEDFFDCPECGTRIPYDALSCPKCGVEFEVEEVFECPMCKEIIDLSTTKCPKCGAEFAEEEAGDKAAPSAEPLSFANRMKQMKEQPAVKKPAPATRPAEPKLEKPMSFADRMRALKDEGEGPKATPTASKAGRQTDSAKATPFSPRPEHRTIPGREDKYKELPKLIGHVKRLLSIAKESGIDVAKSKALISEAVSASKKKDLENAIRMIKEGKTALEKDLRTLILGKHRTFYSAVSLAKKGGKDTSSIERLLDNIKKSVEANDYSNAVGEVRRAEGMVEGLSGASAIITQAEIGAIERTIRDALSLNVNVSKAQDLLGDVKKAAEKDDEAKVTELTREINESLMKILPRFIAKEMRDAKADLREVKMMNIDIGKPVEILKKANNSVQDGDYSAALHAIKEFKDFMGKMKTT